MLAQIVGSFVWGPTDRLFGSYKLPVLIGAAATAAALGYLALVGTLPLPLLIAWFAMLRLCHRASTPVLIAHGRSLFPPHLLGRGHHAAQHGLHGRRVPGRRSSAEP